ncbi:MAG: DMT family transporter [Bacteroidales bacterium]|nr:DMT family transporter [Bacteroidales bacterium]
MNNHRSTRPILAALGAMLFWSFSFVWVKVAYQAYEPLTVVLLRLVISVVLLFVFSLSIRRLQIPDRKDAGIFLLLALFEPFLYFMGESYGLKYVSSTVAAVIVATIPLFAPLFAWYFYREKLSKMNIAGLAASFAGVTIVVTNQDFSFAASPKGVFLEFMAVFSAIAYSTVLRKLAFRYNTFTIITFQNLIGIFMFIPFWMVFEMRGFLATPFHPGAFRAILLLAVFASSLAFILFTSSVRSMGINRSNSYINLIPVFVALLAWLILGDQLTSRKFIGIAVVIAGLFLAQVKTGKQPAIISPPDEKIL